MAKSSINFAKAKAHSHAHNVREDEPKYLLPEERRMPNEFWQNELKLSAKEMFDQEVAAAKPKGGRKPSFESSHWEAVLNFNPEHTIEDVRRVAEHIEAKFGIKCVEIAMHKDEGHIDKETDETVYNLHAHLNFVTYANGKQNWRRELIDPKKLSELQTEVADLMGMERGDPDRKAKRLEHRELKIVKRSIEELERENRQLRTRAETAEKMAVKSSEMALKAQNALLEAQSTILDQSSVIERLTSDLETLKAMYDEDRQKLKDSGTAKQADYQALKKAHDDLKAEIKGVAVRMGAMPPSFPAEGATKAIENRFDSVKNERDALKEVVKSRNSTVAKPEPVQPVIDDKTKVDPTKSQDIRTTLETFQKSQEPKYTGPKVKGPG